MTALPRVASTVGAWTSSGGLVSTRKARDVARLRRPRGLEAMTVMKTGLSRGKGADSGRRRRACSTRGTPRKGRTSSAPGAVPAPNSYAYRPEWGSWKPHQWAEIHSLEHGGKNQ